MLTTFPMNVDESIIDVPTFDAHADAVQLDAAALAAMNFRQLQELQWQLEQLSAREIMKHPKGSRRRALPSATLTTRFARSSAHSRWRRSAAGDGA